MAWASQIEAWNDGATLPTGRQCRHPSRRVPLTSACQLLANPDEATVNSPGFVHQRASGPPPANSAESSRQFQPKPAPFSDGSQPVIPTEPAGVVERTAGEANGVSLR